jgi:hypothetical protein
LAGGFVLNKQLVKLVKNWKESGSPEQEGFNWTSSRGNWIRAFPNEAKFISVLPNEIDRGAVRKICNSKRYSVREKFLAVMVWGYGDRGYGPYRVTQMLSQEHSDAILRKAYEISQSGDPKSAYDFLRINRIRILGPSYSSKFISFCTPREIGAPIYDSLIALWVGEFAKQDFLGIRTSSETWSLKTYSKYWDWVNEHSDGLNCYPDEIELVIFRDAESKFSKSSSWAAKQDLAQG